MDNWALMDATRWDIIQSLAAGKRTMAEIASEISSSLANVSQHLQLLEAYDYVSKEKRKEDGKPGKPTNVYSLNQEFSMIAFANHQGAERKVMNVPDRYHKMILSILMLDNPEDHYFLHKLLWQNEELIQKCKAINYLTSDPDKIELFIITDDLEDIRENFSNVHLQNQDGEEKKIVCWSHNEEELQDGLDSNDEYYENLVEEFHTIYDPDGIMRRWKG